MQWELFRRSCLCDCRGLRWHQSWAAQSERAYRSRGDQWWVQMMMMNVNSWRSTVTRCASSDNCHDENWHSPDNNTSPSSPSVEIYSPVCCNYWSLDRAFTSNFTHTHAHTHTHWGLYHQQCKPSKAIWSCLTRVRCVSWTMRTSTRLLDCVLTSVTSASSQSSVIEAAYR